jgi:hypothetical protein
VDSLRCLYGGGSFFVTLKNLEKVVGSKLFAIKISRIYRFVILAKQGNILQCAEFFVC